MSCLTDEQLAGLALGDVDDARVSVHFEQCEACRAKVATMHRLIENLTAAHAELDRNHAGSRAQLLERIANLEVAPRRPGAWTWLKTSMARLTPRQRVAAGGLGFSTAIALLLLVLLITNSATPLSAMERMVKQLREVTSFSFELEETSDRVTGENRRRIQRNDTTYWRAPASLRASTRMVKLPLPPPGDANGDLLHDIEEIYTNGQQGILIDHTKKTFFRTPELQPDNFPDYSPVNWVQRMSKGTVKVIGDLGTKQLHGKTAHGYVVSLGHPEPDSGQNAVHVWLDTETDLPIEFRYEDSGSTETIDAWTNVMRVFNCRWNIDLDAELFKPIEPLGYDDISWPTDEKSVEEIVHALRLYAELNGGRYPRVTEFHGEEIRGEMLRLAGFTGPPQAEWNDDKLFQRIQQSTAGLDWLTRFLRNKHHTGYYGTEVGPNDKHKALLWWPVDIEDSYRVIYGDLRTEILPLAEWAKLVPPEMAESHTPVEYSKPNESR